MLQVNETVRVAVIFDPDERVRPVWFDWQRRKYQIDEITYRWSEQQGETTLLHFATTVAGQLYELVYDTGTQCWILGAVDTEQR